MALWRALLPVCVALALWQGLVTGLGMQSFILPGPSKVAETLWLSRALIAEHAGITILEVLLGFALGAALGWASAVMLAMSQAARLTVRPILVFTQAVPVFALAPILTLWFGYGIGSKVAMALMIIYFPVTSSFYDALMRTPDDWLAQARVMGASPLRTLWVVRIPAALPGYLSGLRLAAVYAPIGAIIGEWVGSSKGLGYLMLLANGRAKVDLMFAALLVLAVFTVCLHVVVDKASAWILRRRDGSAM